LKEKTIDNDIDRSTMNAFHQMGLPEELLQYIDKLGFTAPTPIQLEAIPLAMNDHDVMGSAQTGTGKTLAFGIPLIAKLMANPFESALILTPTRELAQQVHMAIRQLLAIRGDLKTALLIGGDPYPGQMQQLNANPRLIVGTPGRVIDHIERGTFKTKNVHFLVLDETDRMLDMGFGIQLDQIIPHLSKNRQTMMFSATFPVTIEKLAAKYLKDPKRVSVGSNFKPAAAIKQDILKVSEEEKYPQLLSQLSEREGSVIIFVKTKIGADRLANNLYKEKYRVSAIHGDLRQKKRESVIHGFRIGRTQILVATDVAARGLDIPHIQHVINYDLPQCPEDYIHRIGRTARAGATGFALCLITPQQTKKWGEIQRLMNPDQKIETPRNSGSKSSTNKNSKSFGQNRRRDFDKQDPFYPKKPFGGFKSEGGSKGGFSKPRREFDNDRPSAPKQRFEGAPRDHYSPDKPRTEGFSKPPRREFDNDRPSAPKQRFEGNREGFSRDTPREGGFSKPPRREFDNDRPSAPKQRFEGNREGFSRDTPREGGFSKPPRREFDNDRPSAPKQRFEGNREGFSRDTPRVGGFSKPPRREFDRDASSAPKKRFEGNREGFSRDTPREGGFSKPPRREFDSDRSSAPKQRFESNREGFSRDTPREGGFSKPPRREFDRDGTAPKRFEGPRAQRAAFDGPKGPRDDRPRDDRPRSERPKFDGPKPAFARDSAAPKAGFDKPKRDFQKKSFAPSSGSKSFDKDGRKPFKPRARAA
jgi:ATP-dependent RNA helicase DeaD